PSCSINPYPFELLNHFTFPLAIPPYPFWAVASGKTGTHQCNVVFGNSRERLLFCQENPRAMSGLSLVSLGGGSGARPQVGSEKEPSARGPHAPGADPYHP